MQIVIAWDAMQHEYDRLGIQGLFKGHSMK